MTKYQLVESRTATAPLLPTHRPATKQEVWARYSHIYGEVKTPEELRRFCLEAWTWFYVERVNFSQWDKHPDWVDGEPVIREAVPTGPFEAGRRHEPEVERLWTIAQERKAA